MALGDYTPTAWVNGAIPAINATNLGHIETKIDEIDAATVATTGTIIWSTSNDGNGGQPPAPKPNGDLIAKDSLGIGQMFFEDYSSGTVTTPNCGGTVLTECLTYGTYFSQIGNRYYYLAAGTAQALGALAAYPARIKHTRIA